MSGASMYHLIVTPVGPFGYSVAERLRDLCHDVEVAGTGPSGTVVWPRVPDPAPPGPRLNLLVSWRRVPQIEREFDEESFRSGQPWLPVVLDHPVLEIGPVVVPGAGACHGCYVGRLAQHDAARAVRAAVGRHYDQDPGAGPAGYLPSTALFAAAAAAEVVDRLRTSPAGEAGRVRRIDVPTQQLLSGRVVGVHGCPRCGLGRDETTRSYERLPAILSGVWK
ncbi:TOMM precursor leader peptide-binding protein [Actinoplanes sp. NPDC049118]|uniref:TOMM precursor leader peptide-binding protein n=1 Tax=Actinoplanes sp. NPDC049118 TaxID=3155769 RepID=UPI0033D8BEC9